MYVRQQATVEVERVVDALSGFVAQTESIAKDGDLNDEERALLEMLDPIQDFFRRLREWLELAKENEENEREEEARWDDFLNEHSELSVREERLVFTDEELVDALTETLIEWNEYLGAREKEGVSSHFVAEKLAGYSIEDPRPRLFRPSRSDVQRVGQALARLERQGRVRRVSRSWEANQWAPAGVCSPR